ncbi:hypothetical protein NQ317_015492 [Molorchus minor]|uniref:Transposase n=1 Tax=Molorchus minor TaxID=1323400 RepID=A0ABQ9JIY1_9CUCU|nr:hypothetical protein NQ317_015492 [Molorchus minor]
MYRRNFLKPNTIGIIPKNGYRWRNNQSKIAIQWLIWTEKQLGINIIHTAQKKEIMLSGFNIDGYCKNTNQVFEFHGCYYHGCPTCIIENRDKPTYDNASETMETRYQNTIAKTERLRNAWFSVIEKWECVDI